MLCGPAKGTHGHRSSAAFLFVEPATDVFTMDILALVLTSLAILAALVSVFATRPGKLGTVGVALALFFAAVICQWVNLTGTHVFVSHH